jgi:hypothetical protein
MTLRQPQSLFAGGIPGDLGPPDVGEGNGNGLGSPEPSRQKAGEPGVRLVENGRV